MNRVYLDYFWKNCNSHTFQHDQQFFLKQSFSSTKKFLHKIFRFNYDIMVSTKDYFSSFQQNKPDCTQFSFANYPDLTFKAIFSAKLKNRVEHSRDSTSILTQILIQIWVKTKVGDPKKLGPSDTRSVLLLLLHYYYYY